MITPEVERWFDHLRQVGSPETTIRAYRSVMRGLPQDPLTADRDDLERWWKSQDQLAVTTRNRNLSCVRSFYTWADIFELRADNPTRRIVAPKKGHRLPRPMGRADLHKVLDLADEEMRRAVCLGAWAGLRIAEIAVLDWRDVDLESKRIYVRQGKGDKDRVVGLSVMLLDELLPDTGGNVVSGRRKGYSPAVLQRRVNRLIERAGVDSTSHKLRSRYATMALAATGNLLAVSRALGHASPATTAIYAETADSDLDLIAEAVTR